MKKHSKLRRFGIGAALTLVLVVGLFAIINSLISTWGATQQEVAQVYPGDELAPNPIVFWTHGITINAKPEAVWQWIAQIGDVKAAFYSYTFIENMFAGYSMYHNANQIHPEWQNPQPGDQMISTMLYVRQVEAGKWLLADTSKANIKDLTWSWLWTISPEGEGQTRLVVRMRIQVAPQLSNPALTVGMNLSAFIMERGMLDGLRDRAEGRTEPAWIEVVEIVLWLLLFGLGVTGAIMFINYRKWQLPIATGLASILGLFVFTYLQPVIWLRVLILLIVAAGLWWARRTEKLHPG